MKRKIIEIDESRCDGCGACIPNCQEGALQIVDGKARLISDLFCDGLGACVGKCPVGAMQVVEREAEPYDERRTMREKIIPAGINTIKVHLKHLQDHGERRLYLQALEVLDEQEIKLPDEGKPAAAGGAGGGGCPGSMSRLFAQAPAVAGGCPGSRAQVFGRDAAAAPVAAGKSVSELRQWPVQLALVNPNAAFFDHAELLVAADCAPFAYEKFHRDFLAGKIVINFCPKLDDGLDRYIEKLAAIFRLHEIASVTVVRMEVPCCGGTEDIVRRALAQAGSALEPVIRVISLDGKIVS
jgi:ferredoxin